MKLFELSLGNMRRYVAAEDEAGAYAIGTDAAKHPDICYLPFQISEVTVPGYEIVLLDPLDKYFAAEVPDEPDEDEEPPASAIPTDREELKAWLTERGVEFNPRLGDAKLMELAQEWTEKQRSDEE